MSGAITAISSVFNAFAFAGASWVMSRIDHGDYVKEVHRHDLAMEKFQKDRDNWNESRLREIDRVQQLHYDEHESLRDIEQTNKDLMMVKTKFSDAEPRFEKYYKPSDKLEGYVGLTKFAMILPVAYMVVTLI